MSAARPPRAFATIGEAGPTLRLLLSASGRCSAVPLAVAAELLPAYDECTYVIDEAADGDEEEDDLASVSAKDAWKGASQLEPQPGLVRSGSPDHDDNGNVLR